MTIITHEFGKKKRETVRRFSTALTLDALHERNIQENPVPYLERASERIYQLEKVLFEAVQAAQHPPDPDAPAQMVQVNAAEYQRLLDCWAIVEEGFKRLVTENASEE